MSTEVLLDPQGDLPAPPGHKIIETEMDFLLLATDDSQQLIRGPSLCAWAEAFYNLRGRPYHYQESMSAALKRTFPELTQEQARELSKKIGVESVSPDQVSPILILNYCYPTDSSLWQGGASIEHSASWLLWLYSHHPDDIEKFILEQFARRLEAQAGNSPEALVYRTKTKEKAQSLIYAWFGLSEDGMDIGLGKFPIDVPTELINAIKSKWMQQLIDSKGSYFKQMLNIPLSIGLRQELAKLTAQYYKKHAKDLTREILWLMQPYLSTQEMSRLEEHLPPPAPLPMPQDETAILTWFQSKYLPYRLWQVHHGDEHAIELVHHVAETFAFWYLNRYPQWLLQSEWISFQQSANLRISSPNSVTFCIILDGLPAWDAEDFAHSIYASVERLFLQEKNYIFAPLPTVTEFAKDALLKGVPPRLAPDTPPLGKIIPDNSSPLQELMDANPGDLIFWRLAQPDAAYHFEADAKRKRQVRAELDTILQALREVIDGLPHNTPLQVIVTSDHGRLLNDKSPRQLPVPIGFHAHGRVAWGKLDQEFDESGFIVDENAGCVAINGARFEMSFDMLIALGENSYKNKKSGYEPYPHGGLFPEEAIIPWFVFERDAQLPSLQINLSGRGETGNAGTIIATVTNPGLIALECLSVTLTHGAQVHGYWSILPLDKSKFEINISPWPAKTDLPTLKAILVFRQPNGATFKADVVPSVEVFTMYERDDTLLKDLDLDG